jgi:hypothetical protein
VYKEKIESEGCIKDFEISFIKEENIDEHSVSSLDLKWLSLYDYLMTEISLLTGRWKRQRLR